MFPQSVIQNRHCEKKGEGGFGLMEGLIGFITLQPREQNRNESRRLRSQTSQVLVTPFPGLGWGRSLRKTTLALLIM